jgi:[ribosomal protein S18]-alanine N-acetyltransferase
MSGFFDAFKQWIEYDPERDFYAKHFPKVAEQADVSFRPMKRGDLKAVTEIEGRAYEFPWEPNTFRDCLKTGYCCWVGEKAGQVVAYGILTVGAGESHILNICVDPACQGQGYGRLTLQKLMAVAAGHRAEMMILEVRPSNRRAVKLYHDVGFNEIGTRKGYYPANNGREDALVLARML